MKLIVGLGNPGGKYAGTRHNIGFEVLAELGRLHGAGAARQKFQGEMQDARIGSEKVLLLTPLTFMNRSGNCVQPLRDFFKIANEDILVVCDDFHLPLAQLRLRRGGSAGGQKGLADILRRTGGHKTEGAARNQTTAKQTTAKQTTAKQTTAKQTTAKQTTANGDIARLRVGIGQPPEHYDVADYVLSKFRPDEMAEMQQAVVRAAAAAADWVEKDIDYCMNRYNVISG